MNFGVLISKLLKTQVPPSITNLLSFMFNNSFVNVIFNGEIGDEWMIGNDARQGGILTQILIKVYFNDVLESTLELKAGCKLDVKS